MRKLYILSSILMLILILFGCSYNTTLNSGNENQENQKNKKNNEMFEIYNVNEKTNLLIDKSTSVNYLQVYRNSNFDGGLEIFALINKDGLPVTESSMNPKERFEITKINDKTYVIVDKETKVNYIMVYRNNSFDGGLSVTPRLNSDGTYYTSE